MPITANELLCYGWTKQEWQDKAYNLGKIAGNFHTVMAKATTDLARVISEQIATY